MHLHSFFLYYLTAWRPLGYTLTFIGLMFEGDVTLFTVSFLTREGFFDVEDMLVVVLLSVFIGDVLWYQLGKHVIPKFPKVVRVVERLAQPFDKHLFDRPARTLLMTKFTYGVHHAVLIRAGMFQMDFRRFVKNDILAILIWVGVIGGLGLFSSLSLEYMRKYVRFVEVSLLVGLLSFFVFERILRFVSQKELQTETKK